MESIPCNSQRWGKKLHPKRFHRPIYRAIPRLKSREGDNPNGRGMCMGVINLPVGRGRWASQIDDTRALVLAGDLQGAAGVIIVRRF